MNREARDAPDITAIIVAYNSADMIAGTIRHLEEITAAMDVEIIVVDNASSDESSKRANEALGRSGTVIRSEINLGFGRGVNLGLRQARGRFALIMNDDIKPTPGCIEQMIDLAEADPTIGLIGPRMVTSDNSESFAVRSHLPGPRDEMTRLMDLIRGRATRVEYPKGDAPVDVEFVICACVVARTDLLRAVGGFNDLFFMYGEDIDLSRRLRELGLRLVTVPTAVAVHDRDTVEERRYRGREFSERILNARDIYYRLWIPRPVRSLINLWRAFGLSDQPYRFLFHIPKVLWDGPSLRDKRMPGPLQAKFANLEEPNGTQG